MTQVVWKPLIQDVLQEYVVDLSCFQNFQSRILGDDFLKMGHHCVFGGKLLEWNPKPDHAMVFMFGDGGGNEMNFPIFLAEYKMSYSRNTDEKRFQKIVHKTLLMV